jgi:hypothetical protein
LDATRDELLRKLREDVVEVFTDAIAMEAAGVQKRGAAALVAELKRHRQALERLGVEVVSGRAALELNFVFASGLGQVSAQVRPLATVVQQVRTPAAPAARGQPGNPTPVGAPIQVERRRNKTLAEEALAVVLAVLQSAGLPAAPTAQPPSATVSSVAVH